MRLGKTDAPVTASWSTLRLHRQPARGPGRQGPRGAGRHRRRRAAARRRAGAAADPRLAADRGARRRELLKRARQPRGRIALPLVGLLGVLAVGAVGPDDEQTVDERAALDVAGRVPGPGRAAARGGATAIEVRGDVTTAQTRRLIESAIGTYEKSKTFYRTAAEAAADLDLRQPEKGETVVALVSDRHDNIGMDAVARAVADAGGADGGLRRRRRHLVRQELGGVLAGLRSTPPSRTYDRWGVAGNHDHGSFVRNYLADHGWTMLDGEVVDGPGRRTLLGVDDPRSSGLGSWRDETGLSFDEVGYRLARRGLRRRRAGRPRSWSTTPTWAARRSTAAAPTWSSAATCTSRSARPGWSARTAQAGYTYTNGTTGGAAYAIAVGAAIRDPPGSPC